jgi:hypothetical protein
VQAVRIKNITYFACGKPRKTCVGFEVLTAVVMKSTIFWDITPCDTQRTTRRYIPEDGTLQEKPISIAGAPVEPGTLS